MNAKHSKSEGFLGFTEDDQKIYEQTLKLNSKHSSQNNSKNNSAHNSDTESEDEDEDERKMAEQQIALLTSLMEKMVAVQESAASRSVTNSCRNTIIPFKKDNVRNFLHSVNQTYKEFEGHEDAQLKVIEYAQSRIDTNVEICQKTYTSFESFKTDVLNQFKPKEDVCQLGQQIMMLQQRPDETIKKFGERAILLKDKYEDALFATYELKGAKLDEIRLAESEELVTRHFMLGLKSNVRDFIRGEPESLSKAVTAASTAEASAGLSKTITNYYAQQSKDKPQNEQKKQSYHKNSRGGHNSGRGGYSGYGGYKNYQKNTNNSPQAATSYEKPQQANAGKAGNGESRKQGCWNCGDLSHKQADCKNKTRVLQASAEASGSGWRSGAAPKNSNAASSGEATLMTFRSMKPHYES